MKLVRLPRSSFYYHLKAASAPDKYARQKQELQQLYDRHKGRFGYRRLTLALEKRGININHKTVYRLLKSMGLRSLIRVRKYHSYKGETGRVAANVLSRNFQAEKPNQKWATDVTEFRVGDRKLYLSPILDLFNGEIISYNLSESPNFAQVTDMLKKAFRKVKRTETKGLILHSDQGWQYQMKRYQQLLQTRGITQSMSRKGNCLDNALIENFFGTIKAELFYLNKYLSIHQLKKDIVDYIHYYNHDRIKLHLKGKSPVQYRALLLQP